MGANAQRLILSVDRREKIMFLLSLDGFVAAMSWGLITFLTNGPTSGVTLVGVAVVFCSAALLSYGFGTARTVLRATDMADLSRLLILSVMVGNVGLGTASLLGLPSSLWSAGVGAALFLFGAMSGRLLALHAINVARSNDDDFKHVLIYGAGAAGQQLQAALRSSSEAMTVAFVDDNPSLQSATIGGLKVYNPDMIETLVEKYSIDRVLVAMPSLDRDRRREVLSALKPLPCEVLALPSYIELMGKKSLVESLKPVTPAELLGREVIRLELPEIERCFTGKSVMVTGAGGSIGSELCRQIMEARPARLVLFELTEYALYSIEMELRRHRYFNDIEVLPVLGSICDRTRVAKTIRENQVDVILHAAAYKHVPISEQNPLEVARNNILGTQVVAVAALETRVDRFILVSTDKAVRPTNVMGATKRFAEMIVQNMQMRSDHTIFSMVRFGNVLGSSGSVIPLFKRQIAEGGPITVTHRDITRYFMTIPEAAQLVLLAGSFAEGGEVFVLDMGEPVKIDNLARRLVELSGLEVRDGYNPHGDIEIQYTDLRPGEKLYEELLVGGNTISTPHPKIMRAIEVSRGELEMASAIRRLQNALEVSDESAVRPLLKSIVSEYMPRDGSTPGALTNTGSLVSSA